MPFNVVIATPSTGQCKSVFAFSLARLVAYFAQVRVLPEVPEQSMEFLMLEGSGISSNRERLTNMALERPTMTHMLWIDEDMGFTMDTLHTLARRRQPIVGSNYRMRVPPADFVAVSKDLKSRIQTTAESSGLEEASYTGFGFCLVERKVIEALPKPRYLVRYSANADSYTTEDHPFFQAAAEAGFPCFVDHDVSKRIWHQGNMNYMWDEDYSQLSKGFVKPTDSLQESKP